MTDWAVLPPSLREVAKPQGFDGGSPAKRNRLPFSIYKTPSVSLSADSSLLEGASALFDATTPIRILTPLPLAGEDAPVQ